MSQTAMNAPQDDSVASENAFYVGIDLGTSRSSIASASGVRKTIESYVGWPKDAVSRKHLGGAEIIFGKQALDNRLSLDLYRPLQDGVVKDDASGDRNLEAVKELINYLVELAEPSRGDQVFGVVGVPSEASTTNKQAIIDATKGIFDAVMLCTEPFCVAYGLGRTSDVLVVDIGAGTTDLCRMHGTVPSAEDQMSINVAGDAVDRRLLELIKQTYPSAQITQTMVKRIKENYGYVHSAADKIEVDIPVNGKPTKHDLTAVMREACMILVDPIVDGIHKLVATFDPEFQDRIRNNIILAGGGGLMRGLNKAIEDKLDRVGGGHVTVVEEPMYAGANGALQLALDMPADYWQRLK